MRRRRGGTRLHPTESSTSKPFEEEEVSESQESVTEEASVNVSSNDAEDIPERAATNDDRKERINWPTSTQKKARQAYEEEVDLVLENTLAGTVDRKLAAMATIRAD